MKILNRLINPGSAGYRQFFLDSIRNPIYRNAFFLLTNTVVTSGLGFFFWLVVARFFTTAEVGIAVAVISAMNILTLLSLLGFNDALIRFLPSAEKPTLFINTCLTVSGLVSVILAAVFFIGIDWWSSALAPLKSNTGIVISFILLIVVSILAFLVDSVFVAARRADYALLKNTIFSVLKIPLPILFVFIFREFGIAASWGLASAVSLIIALLFMVTRLHPGYQFRPALDGGVIRRVFSYSAGSYFALLIDSLPAQVLPVLVLNAAGSESNAYFYVTWMIANLLFAIPAAASRSLFAHGSHFDEALWPSVRQTLLFTYGLLMPGIIVIALLAEFLLGLYGRAYVTEGALLLRVLVLSGFFTGINTIYNAVLRVTNHIFELEFLTALKAVVVLGGVYLVIPVTGITGIGYVWLGVQAAASVYALYFLKKRAG